MARPAEFNKEEVLEQAMDVFWEKGYEAASLQDLIDSMGLSKSSFYNAFESKHHLFSETLRHYTHCMTIPLEDALATSSSGLDFIRDVLFEIVHQAETPTGMKGCFLMNTAAEFAQNDAEIGKIMDTGFRQIESVFLKAVKKAQKSGEIAAEKDPNALANFLVCNMSGLKTMAKAGIKPIKLRHILSTLIASLKT